MSVLELGFVERLKTSSAFTGLVKKLRHGWPAEMIAAPTAEALPIVSWFTPGESQLSNAGPGYIEIQTDVWVWSNTKYQGGGLIELSAIDDVMLALLGKDSAVSWLYEWRDAQTNALMRTCMSCVCTDGGSPPEGAKLLRRRRLWEVSLA